MKKTSKHIAGNIVRLIAFMVLATRAPSWAARETPVNLSGWTCATDYLKSQRKEVPVAYRNSEQIGKSVEHSAPLDIPCCTQNLNIKGEIKIDILIDQHGNLECARGVAGNPIAIASAVASLPKWHFRIYRKAAQAAIVIGQLIIPYDFTKK
jgi:hypothetical protein